MSHCGDGREHQCIVENTSNTRCHDYQVELHIGEALQLVGDHQGDEDEQAKLPTPDEGDSIGICQKPNTDLQDDTDEDVDGNEDFVDDEIVDFPGIVENKTVE